MTSSPIEPLPVDTDSATSIPPTSSGLMTDPHRSRGDAAMLRRAAREGWLTGSRWPTDATPEQLIATGKERPLTVKERAMAAALGGLSQGNEPRIIHAAVKSIIAMEQQNQADDLKAPPKRKRPAPPPVQQIVIMDGKLDDAKRLMTERLAAIQVEQQRKA